MASNPEADAADLEYEDTFVSQNRAEGTLSEESPA